MNRLQGILLEHILNSNIMREQWIFLQWSKSVGADIARKTSPCRVSGNTLFVNTVNSVWATHLTALKESLVAALNKNIRPLVINDVRFKAAYPLKRTVDVGEEEEYAAADLERISLTPEEEQKIEHVVSMLDSGDLKKILSSILTKEEKVKKARLQAGWKKCRSCGTLVEKDTLCPFCKIT